MCVVDNKLCVILCVIENCVFECDNMCATICVIIAVISDNCAIMSLNVANIPAI